MADNKNSEKWNTEKDSDPEAINPEDQSDEPQPENIIPSIPKKNWDPMTWHAIRYYIDHSKTREEVIRKVNEWNANNNPRLNEQSLMKKVIWAFEHFDHDLK